MAASPIRQAPTALLPLSQQPRGAAAVLPVIALAAVAVGVWGVSMSSPAAAAPRSDSCGSRTPAAAAPPARPAPVVVNTVVITHGWRCSGGSTAAGDPTGFGASFMTMASAIANRDKVQVLFLDRGLESIDPPLRAWFPTAPLAG